LQHHKAAGQQMDFSAPRRDDQISGISDLC
jgi:hypothetical protein